MISAVRLSQAHAEEYGYIEPQREHGRRHNAKPERKVEKISYGMLMAGRPINLKIRKRLIQSAILRELNTRGG